MRSETFTFLVRNIQFNKELTCLVVKDGKIVYNHTVIKKIVSVCFFFTTYSIFRFLIFPFKTISMVYNPLKQMVGVYHHGPTNEPVSLTTPQEGPQQNIILTKTFKAVFLAPWGHQLDIIYVKHWVLQYISSPKGHQMNIIHSYCSVLLNL